VAQVGDRELADAVAVVVPAGGGELPVVGLDRLARPEVGGDVGDVVAVVGVLGPARIARRQAGERASTEAARVAICTPASL
jgi:hypothetical protein